MHYIICNLYNISTKIVSFSAFLMNLSITQEKNAEK